jgi:hypothetical protein
MCRAPATATPLTTAPAAANLENSRLCMGYCLALKLRFVELDEAQQGAL